MHPPAHGPGSCRGRPLAGPLRGADPSRRLRLAWVQRLLRRATQRPARHRRAVASRDDEGAMAVEFALVATLMFSLLFGTIAFGVHFGARTAAAAAAGEGARAAVAGLTNDQRATLARAAATAVLNSYGGLVDPARSTITVGPDASASTRYAVTVRVDVSQFPFAQLTAFIPALASDPQSTVSVQIGGF
ncbi:TadE family protein [Roseomonas sp. 18066]|uniref:TadE family protein n=1 Tax=Roseomonas sp. 18066 TaxID=2681412 RepID=UPI0013585036|nr:TadE/TadG family type IV pilus assembly protein [Roseomonas sp. 18066]